jgi:hypothetical protein
LANFLTEPEEPGESAWAALCEAQAQTLALSALGTVYGQTDVLPSGPLYRSNTVEGAQIRLAFDHADGGLVCLGERLKGFAIAGEDRKFAWADARIESDTVVVSSPAISTPVAVRYGWADHLPCSLQPGRTARFALLHQCVDSNNVTVPDICSDSGS